MVPIHESDVAENRWKTAEWSSIQLWERVEHQLQIRRRWIIAGFSVLFLLLLSVPIIQDRYPKWSGLSLMRQLAERINQRKLEAARAQKAILFSIAEDRGNLILRSEEGAACDKPVSGLARNDLVGKLNLGTPLTVLKSEVAAQLGLERVVTQICFAPLSSEGEAEPQFSRELALALIPVKDLTSRRTDRISFVFLSGPSLQISFD